MTRRFMPAALLAATAMLAQAPALAQERTSDTPVDEFGIVEGAQLQFSSDVQDDKLTLGIELPAVPSQAFRYSLVTSRTLDEEGQLPSTLDALMNGTSVTLRVGHFGLGSPREDARAEAIEAEAIAACEGRRSNPQPGDDATLTVAGCRSEPNNNIVARYSPRYREYIAHIIPEGATDLGLEATIGFNDFEWIDAGTLAPREERRTNWGITAHVNHYLPGSKTALTGALSYQRVFEAAEEETLCPPGTTDPSLCLDAAASAPARDENLLLTAGIRHQFMSEGRLLNLAVAPAVTYDALDDVFGVDLPVYMLPDTDGGLTGGVRFGYRSDREKEFSVGIFIGAAFNILN